MAASRDEKLTRKIIGLLARRIPIDERRDLLALTRRHGTISAVRDLDTNDPRCRSLREALASGSGEREARARLAEFDRDAGITMLVFGDADYPERLAAIPDAPPIIFVRGDPSVLNREIPYVAMVGSRRADPAGCELTATLSRVAAEQGACIVSGLALGIDSAAHRGALDSDEPGATVAVIGSGLGNIYPGRNHSLAARIVAAGGAIVSQFDHYEPPLAHNFLDRNRIISGLSAAILVIQAPARSGALSTARHAIEQNRNLMVIPGDLADRRYEGSNRILRQGAAVITCVDDFLDEVFGAVRRKPKKRPAKRVAASDESTALRRRIVEILEQHRALTTEEVRNRCESDAQFNTVLLDLELEGAVRRLPGDRLTLSWDSTR